jgi:drug/metabolite transporter (DMT)-like permease
LLKQFALGHKLQKYKWIGIAYNVVSIVLVGLTAMLIGSEDSGDSPEDSGFTPDPLLGVILILCGAFVQSLQYVFEEMVMSAESDIPVSAGLCLRLF